MEANDGKGGKQLAIWPQHSDSVAKNDVSGTSDVIGNSIDDFYEINEAVLLKNLH